MILLIGYGNSLRGDDALGQVAVEHLAQRFHDKESVQVIYVHQLTPELAEGLAAYDLVILIDARHQLPAGELYVEDVQAADQSFSTSFSHYVTPAELLLLADKLYQSSPRMVVVGLTAESFDVGAPLSEPVRAALPRLYETIEALVGAN